MQCLNTQTWWISLWQHFSFKPGQTHPVNELTRLTKARTFQVKPWDSTRSPCRASALQHVPLVTTSDGVPRPVPPVHEITQGLLHCTMICSFPVPPVSDWLRCTSSIISRVNLNCSELAGTFEMLWISRPRSRPSRQFFDSLIFCSSRV